MSPRTLDRLAQTSKRFQKTLKPILKSKHEDEEKLIKAFNDKILIQLPISYKEEESHDPIFEWNIPDEPIVDDSFNMNQIFIPTKTPTTVYLPVIEGK